MAKTKDATKTDDVKSQTKKENGYIGIDFGTSKVAICTSDGKKILEQSVVGYPKDVIARNLLKADVLYGTKALKHRNSLNIKRPVEDGVLINDKESVEAAKGLLEHCLESIKIQDDDINYTIIGVPAEASILNKKMLTGIAKEFFTGVMVVSEPFCVAYGVEELEHAIFVDIGAGTTDLCRVHGTLPQPEDQISIPRGGDFIDYEIIKLITEQYTDASITKELVKKWKESFGFVGTGSNDCVVEIQVGASTLELPIADEIKQACESLVPEIVVGISKLISTYDPEFRDELRKNIRICGGGSRIANIDTFIEEALKQIGGGKVSIVNDPIYGGANGALKLAEDMPPEFWDQMR